jgi:PhnB protein
MPQLNAYLSFDGNCAEAMTFYAEVPGAADLSAADARRIMHAYLVHPEFSLMAGDTPPGVAYGGVTGVMLALTYPTAAEGRRVFDALGTGGKVTMPLGETFWADSFGMVVDRFGVPWGVNGGPRTQPGA